MSTPRVQLSKARRWVIKIGSRALAQDPDRPRALASEIAKLIEQDCSVVLVSSGAIALGARRLRYRTRPKEMGRLQAAAAAGQSVLMRRYDEAFDAVGLTTAQVLLTHADLSDRERLNNARRALGTLLDAGVVPIINENDTVATDEIRFGDNDQMASMVVPLVGAEALVLLTDVDGVLDASEKRIPIMSDDLEIATISSRGAHVGSGGMASKLDAARKATRSGCIVVIAPASEPGVLCRIAAGEDVGTLFPRQVTPLRARKHWIAFTLRPSGALLLDEGAVRAVRDGRSSLLPIGVLGIRGQFNPGDSVRLVGPQGEEIGRGLTRLGALDCARAAGLKTCDLGLAFGARGRDLVVVHKDDLVIT